MAIVVLLFSAGSGRPQSLVIGEKAPELKVAEWLSNRDALSDSRPTLVEFFLSRSEPSLRRLAVLDAIVRDHSKRLNVILLVHESRERLAPVLEGKGYAFAVALGDGSRTLAAYGVQFVPFAVLFDARGRVLWFGNSSNFGEAELRKELGWN